MTYREWAIKNRPDHVSAECLGGVFACPDECFPDAGVPHYCHDTTISSDERCRRCWDREIPEKKFEFEYQGEPIAKVKSVTEENGGVTVQSLRRNSIEVQRIKDSGDRTQFETGAVRDMREGKGRCDLMPLDVVAQVLGGPGDLISYDTVINDIHMFKKTGDTDYLYYALDRFASTAYGKTSTMLLETAIHFEDGAKKYGANNWQKGIPVYCYIDSAIRHYLKFLRGDNDEPHDRAFVWNILCAIWTCINKPELNSYSKEE